MTIVDFIESEYGRGIRQSRLYRKLKAWVQEETTYRSSPVSMAFHEHGFRVDEDERGQYQYSVDDPERFRELALELGGWRQPTAEESRVLLQGAKLLLDLVDGQDARWSINERHKDNLAVQFVHSVSGEKQTREELLEELRTIVARSMPSS